MTSFFCATWERRSTPTPDIPEFALGLHLNWPRRHDVNVSAPAPVVIDACLRSRVQAGSASYNPVMCLPR